MTGPRLIFGAGGIGTTEKGFTYTWDTPEKIKALLELVQDSGIIELDSSASYPPGNPWNAETLLGQTPAAGDFEIDTKVFGRAPDGHPLSVENIDKSVTKSLQLLGLSKVKTLYAHFPDPKTPMEETAAGFHAQYVQGRFDQLGLCNFSLDQLQQYMAICEEKGYVKPTVIQDQYNALSRLSEKLFPFLRQHGMVFYAYSPLAGGFLTGKVTRSKKDASHPDYKPLGARSRWTGESAFDSYTDTFDTEQAHAALTAFHDVCVRHQVSETEVSLRWLAHHSLLTAATTTTTAAAAAASDGDGIILGATREEQLRTNVAMIAKGPLSEELVRAVDEMHARANVGDMFASRR